MAPEESVSEWIALAKFGEDGAATRIYARYFERLLAYARPRISRRNRTLASEEDVAQSVLNIFCDGARNGRFDYVRNRDDLWSILVKITVHKIIDYQRRFGSTPKRPRQVRASEIMDRSHQIPFTFEDKSTQGNLEPDMLAHLQDEFRSLLESLRCDESRRIALLRLEGHTIPEIANLLSRSTRSVDRKLRAIRERWSEMLAAADQ